MLLVSGSLLTASLLGTARLARDVAGSLMFGLGRDAQARLHDLFDPIWQKTVEDYASIRQERYSDRDPDRLQTMLMPGLFSLPQSDSIILADQTGAHFFILRYDDSVRRAELFAPAADRLPVPDPGRLQFVTRDFRPAEWGEKSRCALWDDAGQQLVAWTEVYPQFTTKAPSISAAVAARDPAGTILVVTYGLPLDDVAQFTTEARPSPRGVMFVMTDDGKMLGPPRGVRTGAKADASALGLQPIAEAGFPSVAQAVAKWRADHQSQPDHFRIALDGEAWWAGFTPFEFGSRHRFWIGMLLPESDLAPAACCRAIRPDIPVLFASGYAAESLGAKVEMTRAIGIAANRWSGRK